MGISCDSVKVQYLQYETEDENACAQMLLSKIQIYQNLSLPGFSLTEKMVFKMLFRKSVSVFSEICVSEKAIFRRIVKVYIHGASYSFLSRHATRKNAQLQEIF